MNEFTNKAKRQAIKQECALRGIAIRRPSKHCWHLVGPGIDVMVADLAYVGRESLEPYVPKGKD